MQSVYVVREGKAVLVDVEIGERNEQFVQITSGNLKAGDTIVTTNILRIKNNSPVRIEKAE